MSGIAGVLYRDGRRAAPADAQAMVAAMPHRCRDGIGAAADGAVALAHGALHTLAEDAAVSLPLSFSGCLVTADARLDNREELMAALRGTEPVSPRACEAEIIARAYLRWGESCVERLLGDFAFALWDSRRRVLFCGRDHFGSKPFCYHASESLFAFGSEPKAMLALPDIPRDIDEEFICTHFHPNLLIVDRCSTLYTAIRRLEPAHRLVAGLSGLPHRKSRYWQLDPHFELEFSSERQYIDRLREVFFQAVRARLRTPYGVGSTLSGGIDSSAVVCAARSLFSSGAAGTAGNVRLRTYSALFDNVSSADERSWIEAVTAGGGLDARAVHPDEARPLLDLDTVLWLHDGPFYGANYFIHWHIYRAAAADGVRVLLDGEDGDSTISHGSDQLVQLVQAQRWSEFGAEADAVVRMFDNEQIYASRRGMVLTYGYPYLAYLAERGRWIALLRAMNGLHREFRFSRRRMLADAVPRRARSKMFEQVYRRDSVLRQELALTHRIDERLREVFLTYQAPSFPSHPRRSHYRFLTSGALTHGFEVFERMAAYWGVELRHPFTDLRLAEFCLAIPSGLKLRNGMSRYVFREALKGILPEAIRLRGGKGDLSGVSDYGLQRYEREFLSTIPERVAAYAGRYVESERAAALVRDYLNTSDPSLISHVWKIATLTRWLDPERSQNAIEESRNQTSEMAHSFRSQQGNR